MEKPCRKRRCGVVSVSVGERPRGGGEVPNFYSRGGGLRRTCTLRRSVHPPRSRSRGNRIWTRRHVSRPADCRPKVAPHLDNISLGAPRSVASKFSRGLQREGEAVWSGSLAVWAAGRSGHGKAGKWVEKKNKSCAKSDFLSRRGRFRFRASTSKYWRTVKSRIKNVVA